MLTNGCFVKVQLLNNDAIFCIHVHFTPHTLTSTYLCHLVNNKNEIIHFINQYLIMNPFSSIGTREI